MAPADSATCARLDSEPGFALHGRARGNGDSLLVVIDSLERRLRSAPADTPALLLALGRAKSAFQPWKDSAQIRFARARPTEFGYAEPHADWQYNGSDFQSLIQRFPKSPFADSAAYELTILPISGECEDDVSCNVSYEWKPLSTFLRAYPNSPLADTAIARVLAAFREFPPGIDLRSARGQYTPRDTREQTAELDSLARLLPATHASRLFMRAGELWQQLDDYGRAKAAYQAALIGANAEARECLEGRLAALPERPFSLDEAHVVHGRRVDLRWEAPAGARQFVVYRSGVRGDLGSVLARLPANTLSWVDTTVQPSSNYWYHVVAETAAGSAQSNPSAASTPGFHMWGGRIAVSTTDRHLYVFGGLGNGFPQVARISPDGASIERSDGMLADGNHVFDADVGNLWFADLNGTGVLHFRRTGRQLPADLVAAVRERQDYMRSYVGKIGPGVHGTREVPMFDGARPIVSVDEPVRLCRAGQCAFDYSPGSEQTITLDHERRILWFVQPIRRDTASLMRVDLNRRHPLPEAVATNVNGFRAALAPDLSGGVWLAGYDSVSRIDADGRVRFAVSLNPR